MQDEYDKPAGIGDASRFQVIIIMVLFVSMIVLWGVWIGLDLSSQTDSFDEMLTAEQTTDVVEVDQEVEEDKGPSLEEAANTAPSVFLEESTAALIKDIMATIPGLEQNVKKETFHLHTRYQDLMVMGEYPDMRAAREAREAREAAWKANMAKNAASGGAADGRANSAPQLNAAFDMLRSGQPAKALSEFERAVKSAPGNLNARMGKAQALYALNRSGEAQKVLQKVVSERPNHPGSLLMLGALSQESGNNNNARKYYKSYLKHHPTGRRSDEIRQVLNRL